MFLPAKRGGGRDVAQENPRQRHFGVAAHQTSRRSEICNPRGLRATVSARSGPPVLTFRHILPWDACAKITLDCAISLPPRVDHFWLCYGSVCTSRPKRYHSFSLVEVLTPYSLHPRHIPLHNVRPEANSPPLIVCDYYIPMD